MWSWPPKTKGTSSGYRVAVAGRQGEVRDRLVTLLHHATAEPVRVSLYGGAGEVPAGKLQDFDALYLLLDSREEIAAAHTLRAKRDWPLVMITGNVDFGIDAFALGALHCMMPPLEPEAVREGLMRCVRKRNQVVVVRGSAGKRGDLIPHWGRK